MPSPALPCCQKDISHKMRTCVILCNILPIWGSGLIYKFPTPVITAPSVFIFSAFPAKIAIITYTFGEAKDKSHLKILHDIFFLVAKIFSMQYINNNYKGRIKKCPFRSNLLLGHGPLCVRSLESSNVM